MSVTKSGVKAHDDACNAAEGVRQVAVATAANHGRSEHGRNKFLRTVAKSCRDNNNYSGVSVAMAALRSLGVTGL